jgi:hypothetical protein
MMYIRELCMCFAFTENSMNNNYLSITIRDATAV